MSSTGVASALLQTTGLLLPVVFLAMSFVRRNTMEEVRPKDIAPFVSVFIGMIIFLTLSGLSSSLVLMGFGDPSSIIPIGASAMFLFFLLFGYYIYLLVKAIDDSIKRHM